MGGLGVDVGGSKGTHGAVQARVSFDTLEDVHRLPLPPRTHTSVVLVITIASLTTTTTSLLLRDLLQPPQSIPYDPFQILVFILFPFIVWVLDRWEEVGCVDEVVECEC